MSEPWPPCGGGARRTRDCEPGFRPEARAAATAAQAQETLTGAQILARQLTGRLDVDHMHREGGWGGALLVGDLAGDRWRTCGYPVRPGAVPGDPGWFPISDFLDRI